MSSLRNVMAIGAEAVRRIMAAPESETSDHANRVVGAIMDAIKSEHYAASYEAGRSDYERACCDAEADFALSWALGGFPHVLVSARLAASLQSTSITAETDTWPWPSFAVSVNGGNVIQTDEFTCPWVGISKTHDGSRLTVGDVLPGASSCARAPTMGAYSSVLGDDAVGAKMDDFTKRTLLVSGRLAVGAALEMSARAVGAPPAASSSSTWGRRRHGEPDLWTYRLTRNVAIDCREAVAEFISGRGKSPTVQSLIRGHWKRQVCGTGGTERKWIHVEPYWRGPEDAPIAVRSHLLGTRVA